MGLRLGIIGAFLAALFGGVAMAAEEPEYTPVQTAGYSGPWVPGPMKRQEVWVEIEAD